MRHGFHSSLLALFTGAGLALAQAPQAPVPLTPQEIEAAALKLLKKEKADKAGGKQSEVPNPLTPSDLCPAPAEPAGISVKDEPNAFESDAGIKPCDKGIYFPSTNFWVSAESLRWFLKREATAGPLISTNPGAVVPALNARGTSPVGDTRFDYGTFSGGRFSFGYMNDDQTAGFEVTGLLLEERTKVFGAARSSASGSPAIGRPVIDTLTGNETAQLVALPGAFAGNVVVTSSCQLWGTEANLFSSDTTYGPEFFIGFRYMGLEEDLTIAQTTNVLALGNVGFKGELVTAGSTVNVIDHIQTRNDFYGGQVGLQKETQWGHFFLCSILKVAIGENHETVNTFGVSTLLRPNGTTATAAGGLLAVQGTSLLKSLNPVSVIPEIGMTAGFDITPHIRISAGYTFMYWSDVVRSGVQYNRVVNAAVVPTAQEFGTSAPQLLSTGPTFRHSDFWAQGVSFGVSFRY